ncbi:MAG TPA: TonB-dependent receptor [Ignavibacteriaceae bacterium]|nr:TonB-dependent receptor [Ignavibacteriaceae bacterium]
MKQFRSIFTFLILISSINLFAQTYEISGRILNADNNEPLVGANVFLLSANLGSTTDEKGFYSISKVSSGVYEIRASYLGFTQETKTVKVSGNVAVDFKLVPSGVLLGETVVKGTRATLRETPVAFSEVQGKELEFKLASRDVPHILQSTPGIYVSQSGGGAGDARVQLRGFDQRNTAIMINGVPVNDMENGWVYWSNWAGLGDVTENIQVQRGLGASPYSVSAVGGVINVVTKGVGNLEPFTKLRTEFGDYNLRKTSVAFGTKVTNNIGLTALVSRKTWDGYADQTWLDEFTYFFSLGGLFGNHSLEFQAVGSPQKHGQRTTQQSIKDFYARGFQYNQNWGYLHGKPLNEVVNYYHKPAFNLNHNWQISKDLIMSNIVYFSFGDGGGTGRLGSSWSYTTDGLINFDAAWNTNASTVDSNYSTSLKKSTRIIRSSVNSHTWYGALSTFRYTIQEGLVVNAGLDGRYYRGFHYRTVDNLLGGDYFVDTKNANRKSDMHFIKDIVDYNNDGLVRQLGGFGQVEYKTGPISSFVNLSVSHTAYQRIDYYRPDGGTGEGEKTDWQGFLGYTGKAGLNFNLDDKNSIFANAGYFSKAPLFRNVFSNLNQVYDNIKNEKILGLELGYMFTTQMSILRVNGYLTNWENRSISRSVTNPVSGLQTNYNFFGAGQRHVGFEFEGVHAFNRNLEVNASLSYALAKYTSDVDAILSADDDPTIQTKIQSFVNGIKVGDFPMTTASLGFTYTKKMSDLSEMTFNPVYNFFGRHYAFFDPDGRTNVNDKNDSWRLPDFYLFDVHVGYNLLIVDSFFKRLSVGMHLFNALNNRNYITDATDGANHDGRSARVFFGRERSWNLSLTFDF